MTIKTNQKSEVVLRYGALSKDLEDQLNEQGYTLGDKQESTEELRNALIMCQLFLMTDEQYKSCLNKFHKKVVENIKPIPNK